MDQPSDRIHVRPYHPGDEERTLALLAGSLGWAPDEHHRSFFAWKHRQSPFGPSPAWVAVDGDRIVGLRIFLRWEFERAGEVLRAVRAVDTATHPDYRGQGVFRRLTLAALADLPSDGTEFVFNTPNGQSLPGYVKMGWEVVGNLPVLARPRSARSALRMAGARTAAELWSTPCSAGVAAEEGLADGGRLSALLASQPGSDAIRTRRSVDYLRWRFGGFRPLRYRVLLAGGGVDDGLAIFRLRRRGGATEATICDVIVPDADARRGRRLMRRVVSESGADYGARLGGTAEGWAGFLPLPGQGPVLTFRDVAGTAPPPLERWRLTLGDVELF